MTVQDSGLDIFFYDNGNNLIALKSITKKPQEKWKQWQEEPMPIELYEKQKKNGDFDNGYGIITGKLWRGTYQGKYLVCIDIDNKKGIDIFFSYFSQIKTIDQLAQNTLVVQHKDAKEEKVHIYFIIENPITKRSGFRGVRKERNKEVNDEEEEIPKIEVKSDSSTYVVGPGSTHKSGHPYEIIGINKPRVLNKEQSEQLETALNDIYERYGNKNKNNQNGMIPISELFKDDFRIYEGNNRQEAVLRVSDSLIQRLEGIYPTDKIREMAYEWNKEHCKPPLDDKEFGVKWDNAIKFLEKKSIDEKNEKEEGEDQARVSVADIIASVKERYIEIFKDQINTFYVTLKINDHVECIPLQSNRFKNVIRKEFFDKIGQLISDDKLDGIIKLIESQSMFDDNIRKIELSLRVAKQNGNDSDNDIFYYDLTNSKWEIVRISPDNGWKIITDNQEPIFKRYENNSNVQVYPSHEYEKDVFKQFLKLFNFVSRRDILLFSVYLISLFIPEIPKVILVIKGTGGGAKTTAFKMIKEIVDPSSADILSFPKQTNDLIQTLDHHYVNFFDNVSSVSEEVSDMLCRAVTGSGNMKRALFTNDSDFIYKFRRCIGINGINLATTKADFLDRSLIIEVKRIEKEKRKKEDEIDREFERLKPFVLGFIFDILTKALKYRTEHKGEKILKNGYPRMADFAEWSEIISRCLGYQDNEFLNAYYENIYNQNDEIIESSPVAEAIVLYMNELEREYWEGTPTRLYKTLTDVIDQIKPDLKRSNVWPKASNTLTSMINDVAHNLKEKGIEVITGERDSQGNRVIKIRKLRKSTNNNNNYENMSENRAKNNNIDDGLLNPHIHRVGSSDNFECDNCPLVEDIHFMKQHKCSGDKNTQDKN